MRETIENVKVVDEEGNDVTPEKIKQIRRNKLLNYVIRCICSANCIDYIIEFKYVCMRKDVRNS